MSEPYQKAQQNSSHRKENDIGRHEMIKNLLPVLDQCLNKGIECLSEICPKGEELERCDHSGGRKLML